MMPYRDHGGPPHVHGERLVVNSERIGGHINFLISILNESRKIRNVKILCQVPGRYERHLFSILSYIMSKVFDMEMLAFVPLKMNIIIHVLGLIVF